MENATKALFIVAGVLVGMMMLSLGVALYYSLQGYISDTQDTMEQNANNKFNTQFLKYINMQPDDSGTITYGGQKYKIDFKLRVQDIITAANTAYQNNIELTPDFSLIDPETDYNENNLYVTVNATLYDESGNADRLFHLERNVNELADEWLSKYTSEYQYKCYGVDVKMSEITGRVYEISFK